MYSRTHTLFQAVLGSSLPRFVLALVVASGVLAAEPATAAGNGGNSEGITSTAATAVRGRVLNEVGQPLVGATVFWKGSPYGVSTDAEGRYQLPLAAGRTVITFGYAGYSDEDVTVRGGGTQNITLLPVEQNAAATRPAGAERRPRR